MNHWGRVLIYSATNTESTARNIEFILDFEKTKTTHSLNSSEFFKSELDDMKEYHASVGLEYASVFAEANSSDYIFYDAGPDCTNFVSQCVWASYAGFDKNDIAQAETDIDNNKCMVTSYPSGWHASGPGGGGYPNWESVTNFYDYCVSSKSYGPEANGWGGYSDNQLSPYAPAVGNVLQWSHDSASSSYAHSTYVTKNLYNGSMSGVYLSYHTADYYNHSILYCMASYQYVRGLSFTSANF